MSSELGLIWGQNSGEDLLRADLMKGFRKEKNEAQSKELANS